MSEPKEINTSPELEEKLNRFYQDVTPQADFADRLEAQLVEKATALQESAASPSRRNFFSGLLRRPLLVGAMAVLLVLTAAIGIIGPQKVLAEVQRLFGYLPGYGFLQANQVRVLAEPVVVRQGEVRARTCPSVSRPHSNEPWWYRNVNLLCIAYAFPPRLSSRLTLSRRSLLRKP